MFITFEGPEGSGKSTQLKMLADRLTLSNYDVITVREPGGTIMGEAVRNILQHDSCGPNISPVAETLLFEASRAQLIHEVIGPALAQNTIVLSDRFIDSTMAYQGYGRKFPLKDIEALNSFATQELMPDITILLDLPVEAGFERIFKETKGKANLDRMERESMNFHNRVANGYRGLAAADNNHRFTTIDANRSLEEVHEDVLAVVLLSLASDDT